MRLTQIKLAGFKSFIDPTTIHVPSQLVAVIGPNGCGKSNVIDAVRWVLGESSAKQLRGESMQDVISNGAATRRPAPRASVELVFDNSDHVLQGAWGQYAEIAIKRQLTRQGDSSYFINNQAVRRRDITDLFLGTGVGAKGYAVIEQGMISRIIEARPEELRVYIEEAAGVSKYKERRRETAARLDDTREHLQRLSDLQTELARQVEKLNAQAATAEQYRSLKDELAQNQNLSDYIQWQNAIVQADAAQAQHASAKAQQESHQANSDSLNQRIQELRLTEREQQQQHDNLQQQHAQSREHIARLEEQIRAQHAQNERAERDRQSAQAQLQKLQQQHADTLAEREALLQQAADKHSELAALALIVAEHEARLPELEAAEQTSQHNHQSQQDQIGSLKREHALKQQQQQHTQATLANHRSRLQRLADELAQLGAADNPALQQAKDVAETLQHQCQAAEIQWQHSQAQLGSLKTQQQKQQAHYQTLNQQHIAAQAQQQAIAQILHSSAPNDFWATTDYAQTPSLWQQLTAPEAWQHAISVVLAERLHAKKLPAEAALPSPLPQGAAAWLNQVHPVSKKTQPAQALLNQIQAHKDFQAALHDWLDGILCAPDLDYAIAHQSELAPQQIWLTPQGHRVDRHSITLYNEASSQNLIQQKAQHDQLSAQLDALAPQLAAAQQQAEEAQTALDQAEAAHAQAQEQYRELLNQLQHAQNHANQLTERSNQAQLRREHIAQEQAQLQDEIELLAQQSDSLAEDSETLVHALAELEHQFETLSGSLKNQQHANKAARLALLEANRQYGAAEVEQHKIQQRADSLAEQAAQILLQQQDWQQRIEEAALAQEADAESHELAEQLVIAQESSTELAERIAAAQDTLAATQAQGQDLFQQAQAIAAELPQIQAAVQTALLQQQQALLNAQRYHEQLTERGADLDALAQAEHSGSLKSLSQHINSLLAQIEALGAVNLAALDELAEAQQRSDYYRSQSEDVQNAIALLEEAIAQIDHETQTRFLETFNAVNAKMQSIFPTLFGGGEATLQLTDSDPLSAGISIMARPIGKKNSSIHLLSGGEKALTAMSLVFALFSLNPAPFCLLDEVDAPLDDANTSRFCQLVKEMSAQTQFLYISHNRLTMEMAEQLIGVTMQEKGVSRIVAVDIKQAMQMAEAA